MEQYAPFLFLIIYLIYTFWNAGKKYKKNRPGQQKPPQQQPTKQEYAPYARTKRPQPRQTRPVQQRQQPQPHPVTTQEQPQERNPLEELLGPMWQEMQDAQEEAERKAHRLKEQQQQKEVAEEARKLREEQDQDRLEMERRLKKERKQEEERKRRPLPEYHPVSLMEDFDPVKAVIYTEIFKRPEY